MSNAIDLVVLNDLKLWLDIPLGTTTDDTLLGTLITNVSQAILTRLKRVSLVVSTYAEAYDGSGTPQQALRQFPITSVSSLTINSVPIIASPDGVQTGYTFDEYVLKLVGTPISYPFGPGVYGAPSTFLKGFQNVSVTYDAGYAAIPFDINEAAKEWCAVRYRARKWIGQTSKHLATGETVSFSQKAMPDFVRDTLDRYERKIPV
jgi:hypothetical protein